MHISVDELFDELTELTQKAVQFGLALKKLDHYQLKFKPEQNVWNIYECLEHLNLYGDHYLDEIEKALNNSKPGDGLKNFKGSILGNYFVKIIRPVEGDIKKMKTTKAMDPIASDLTMETVDRFIAQQKRLLELLNRSKHYNLKKIKIKTTLSNFLYLNLGDTLRFVVHHNERHLVQAGEMLQKVGKSRVLSVT
ncbi:DinB family protein [Muricauda sp. MAR_2010_75]|uniref:DinB family protein n=1 Tax=Allomuricauda sp. MAR_2010_75 TaxID=1250232 RepID=UPI000561ABF0|nr:DinB family protein [Muricauda sp. MAR_2010_75]